MPLNCEAQMDIQQVMGLASLGKAYEIVRFIYDNDPDVFNLLSDSFRTVSIQQENASLNQRGY